MYLFKGGKVYEYEGQRVKYTLDLFLEYLSGDNYINQSNVKSENSDLLIKIMMGQEGDFMDMMYLKYGKDFENFFKEKSKKIFK